MGRDSILDDAEQSRQQNEQVSDQSLESADEADGDRVRITQRLPADLAADVDAVQEKYSLPSRNATINFILNQGVGRLLNDGDRP
jgi:multidrug resistance efflux pump